MVPRPPLLFLKTEIGEGSRREAVGRGEAPPGGSPSRREAPGRGAAGPREVGVCFLPPLGARYGVRPKAEGL